LLRFNLIVVEYCSCSVVEIPLVCVCFCTLGLNLFPDSRLFYDCSSGGRNPISKLSNQERNFLFDILGARGIWL